MGRRKQANPKKAVGDANVLRISDATPLKPSSTQPMKPSTSKSSTQQKQEQKPTTPIEWLAKKVESLKRPNKENVVQNPQGPLKNLEAALDLRVKRRRDESSQMPPPSLPTPPPQASDVLGRLSSLVTNVGGRPSSFRELNRRVSKQETSEDSSIFTCLQCHERFLSMQQLVIHMEKTKHFFSAAKLAESVKPDLTKEPRGNMRYGTEGYKCTICGFITKENIEHHMTTMHRFKDHSEWQTAVKLIPHESVAK